MAAFLGVDMPTVGVGESCLSRSDQKRRSEDAGRERRGGRNHGGSFSAEVLTPARLQASFFYSREDRARFAGMDAALRQNLNEALSDGLDKQVVVGDDGLLDGTNLANHNVSCPDHVCTLSLPTRVWARVDGTFATSAEATCASSWARATYAHAASAVQGQQRQPGRTGKA